jgi:hypothetical protein
MIADHQNLYRRSNRPRRRPRLARPADTSKSRPRPRALFPGIPPDRYKIPVKARELLPEEAPRLGQPPRRSGPGTRPGNQQADLNIAENVVSGRPGEPGSWLASPRADPLTPATLTPCVPARFAWLWQRARPFVQVATFMHWRRGPPGGGWGGGGRRAASGPVVPAPLAQPSVRPA